MTIMKRKHTTNPILLLPLITIFYLSAAHAQSRVPSVNDLLNVKSLGAGANIARWQMGRIYGERN